MFWKCAGETGQPRGACGNIQPIVPKDLRLEVEERTLADGTIDIELDVSGVRAAASYLLQQNCSALSIVFINSYVNSENEEKQRKPFKKYGQIHMSQCRAKSF